MPQYKVEDNSVTLYLNGIAHVTTLVKLGQLRAQNDIAKIVGIALKADLESLHTILDSKGIEIKRARVLEPTTLAEIAKSKIGDEVRDRESGENVRVYNVKDGQLLVGRLERVYSKPLNAFEYGIKPEDIREERVLELKLEGLNEKQTLKMSYLTGGIKLTPHYNIVLTNGELVLSTELKVENRTGKPYYNVNLETIPGNIGKAYVPVSREERPRIRRVEAFEESLVMAVGVTRFEEEGQVRYELGRQDLPEGHSRFSVGKTKGLDYEIIYRADLNSKPKIKAALRFTAPFTIPIGSVDVYREKSKSEDEVIERYEGGGAIEKPVLEGEDANITLREPDTLEMKVEQIGKAELVETKLETETVLALEREFKVTARNAGEEDVTIETYLELRDTEELIETSLTQHAQHEKSSERKIRWDLAIEAGQKTTFNYKTRDSGVRLMTKQEIKARGLLSK